MWGLRGGAVVYRVALFVPYVLPQVAVGVVWGWIYAPTRGWLNRALEALGLGALTTGWLGDPRTALYAVLIGPAVQAFLPVLTVRVTPPARLRRGVPDDSAVDGEGEGQDPVGTRAAQLAACDGERPA